MTDFPKRTDAFLISGHTLPIVGSTFPTRDRTFEAPRREPKLVTIFVHDAQGRMLKHNQATIEGTFGGPDAPAELVAIHLH